MLSAGPRLRGHRDAQRELVAELDGAGTTALGFGIQPVFEKVPAALLAEARERSFPVFAVPPSTPFRDIVSAVNRCLMSGDLVNYERLSSMQRYLMDALQEDEPERAVIARLAKLIDARVLVFDPGGRLEMATGRGAGGRALAPDRRRERGRAGVRRRRLAHGRDADRHDPGAAAAMAGGDEPAAGVHQQAHAAGGSGHGAAARRDGPARRRGARPGARDQGLAAGGRPEGAGRHPGRGARAGGAHGVLRADLRRAGARRARARADARARPASRKPTPAPWRRRSSARSSRQEHRMSSRSARRA